MLLDDFKRILTTFADSPGDIDISRGKLTAQLREEVLEAQLDTKDGMLWVRENGVTLSAHTWLIQRVARLHLLADRIVSYVDTEPNFITPSGRLVDRIETNSTEMERPVNDALETAYKLIDAPLVGTASVLYLTSDAGEGKTTLVHQMARSVASRYKAKEASWLLIPISLGGRPFLRFDDIVVAALVNRLRFPLLYYEAFIELVRLGALVPAFDGFEEMFVESNTGEALSALGDLVDRLDSSGSVVISARKAFFEYKSFSNQAKLFDAIRGDSVSFARLALNRWERKQFEKYAGLRGVEDPSELYSRVESRLGIEHPLTSRAVLARRLVDVALSTTGIDGLLATLGDRPQDYFAQFVNTIVEREAHEKWLDRSGETARPLLSVDQHHELLAMIAQEMWITNTEVLRADVLDLVSEVFTESQSLTPSFARQVKERVKQHSLITAVSGPVQSFGFDHEDFRNYYLGFSFGHALIGKSEFDSSRLLSGGALSQSSLDAAAQLVKRSGVDQRAVVSRVADLCAGEPPSSFTRENAGGVAIRLLDKAGATPLRLKGMIFPSNSLGGRVVQNVTFEDCYFQPTELEGATIERVEFVQCTFERIEIQGDARIVDGSLRNCEIGSVVNHDRQVRAFDPHGMYLELGRAGFDVIVHAQLEQTSYDQTGPDEDLVIVERAFRLFLRATQINDQVFRQRLGVKANRFVDHILPDLIKRGILEEIVFAGAGSQIRVRLAVPMKQVDSAIAGSHGSYTRFVAAASPKE